MAVRLSEVIDAHRDKSEQTTVLGEDFDDGADATLRADRMASFLCLLTFRSMCHAWCHLTTMPTA